MKYSKLILLFAFTIVSSIAAQENIKSFDYKKGEVLDIILLSQIENPDELFERYKKTAFPVAFKYTYQPQPGFKIANLTLGTNKPQSFLFGKWASLEKRKSFLKNIVEQVPDFHQQRRDLFPYFGLTYYEMNADLKFSINTSKFNVATSLWAKSGKPNTTFFKNWKTKVAEAGGKVVVTLKNGVSPIGYVYDPYVLYITEWQNEVDFKAFAEKNPLASYSDLYNVHQFVIQ